MGDFLSNLVTKSMQSETPAAQAQGGAPRILPRPVSIFEAGPAVRPGPAEDLVDTAPTGVENHPTLPHPTRSLPSQPELRPSARRAARSESAQRQDPSANAPTSLESSSNQASPHPISVKPVPAIPPRAEPAADAHPFGQSTRPEISPIVREMFLQTPASTIAAPAVKPAGQIQEQPWQARHPAASSPRHEIAPREPTAAIRPAPAPIQPPRNNLANAVEPSPTIQVSIGRIEVRLTGSPAARPVLPAGQQPAPVMTLEDYLRMRNGGRQ
jgi:hypothetical protein